ncbi:hypothetical protein ACKKBG_A02220 [Auxenochlorella protothecoides x Auxenochlorella symbiontica]
MSLDIDDPPNSRLFVVAGRATSAEFLRDVFEQFGVVSFVKYLRDKGVAYVKYDRASSAALAIENLHEVTLNDGRGPRLKVILAESPHMRSMHMGTAVPRACEDASLDPDNSPPRSRLFLVVPKSADGSAIEAAMSAFPDLQYCKTDLVASKGIVFVKYARSSSAAAAMEAVQASGQVAGYRVKIMLAEPKVRRSPSASSAAGMLGGGGAAAGHARAAALQALLAGGAGGARGAPAVADLSYAGLGGGLFHGAGLSPYALPLLGGGLGDAGAHALHQQQQQQLQQQHQQQQGGTPGPYDHHAAAPPGALADLDFSGLAHVGAEYAQAAGLVGLDSVTLGGGGAGFLSPMTPSLSASSSASQLSRQRLFVVLHKSVGDETLACLFRSFPGMEYCDLKKDRATGRSKGYAYVKYATHESAAAAQARLNGAEFPPGSGCRMKVMFAEPALHRARSGSADSCADAGTPFNLAGLAGGGGAVGVEELRYLSTPGGGQLGARGERDGERYMGRSQGVGERYATQAPGDRFAAQAPGDRFSAQAPGDRFSAQTPGVDHFATQTPGVDHFATQTPGVDRYAAQTQGAALGSPLSCESGVLPRRRASPLHSPLLSSSTPDLLSAADHLAGLCLDGGGLEGLKGYTTPGGALGALSPGTTLSGSLTSSWHDLSPEGGAGSATSALGAGAAGAGHAAAAGLRPRGDAADPDPTVVYSRLARPLPDYALSHVFSRCGPVDAVRVLPDVRLAMVKFRDAESAARAVATLHGTEVLGEVLAVCASPPSQ